MSSNVQQPDPTAGDPGWEATTPNAYKWTTGAFDLLQEGKLTVKLTIRNNITQATATGQCPRCTHNFTDSQLLDAVTGENIRTLGTEKLPTTGYIGVTVTCKCTEPHSGRPTDVHVGCGINFQVEVNAESVTR